MARPSLKAHTYLTTTQVAKALGMTDSKVIRWIDHGVLPWPTAMEHRTRLFSREWLATAQDIIREMQEGKGL